MKKIYLSQQGYDDLKNELQKLKSIDRPAIIRQIAEARDKGDLSENAEYDAAKEAQGLLEARISKLENDLAYSRILEKKSTEISTVQLLTKVKIQNLVNNMKMTYVIVSESEANLAEKKISSTSPIGKGLLGKSIGDIANINTPSGVIQYKVLDIKAS